ncbi:MAG: hypothetical protein HQL12_08030 [Candidatus Omnitrophica bacterium]|nr:hypothetical protein [Candidatus Omnitrophota bacterium]
MKKEGIFIKNAIKQRIVLVLLMFWLFCHVAQPIKLAGADIGRHIKNGELLLSGVKDVLYKNYYSYTCGQYPFVNHHWLFGIFCYIVWRLFDFSGLSLVYAVLILATFWLFFRQAQRLSSFALACAFSLLSFPLLTCRVEIRPEGITLLFCILYWWLCIFHQQGRLKPSFLCICFALLQLIWVNTHVFFILGPLLIGLFWLQANIDGNKDHANALKASFWLSLGMCLANPSGIAGALLPLEAFKHFGVNVNEEQSVFFALKNAPHDKLIYYFLATIPLLILPWISVIKKQGIKPHISMLILIALFTIASIKCIRFISPYGYFFIPLASYAWGEHLKEDRPVLKRILVTMFIIAGILASPFFNFNRKQGPALGLESGVNASAQFFKQAGLKGPIFNNYDIGGYLIFHLSPDNKLFVDDRKEAYPDFFFKGIFIPMQLNDANWEKTLALFHFNVIFFDRHDQKDWGWYKFIIARLDDPSWVPVFVDNYAIIFLRRTAQNADLISRYALQVSKEALPGNGWGYKLYR